MSLTRDDWLRALDEAGVPHEHDAAALTVDEYAEMFTISRVTAGRQLDRLVKAGKAARTYKRQCDRNGRLRSYVAYRLLS